MTVTASRFLLTHPPHQTGMSHSQPCHTYFASTQSQPGPSRLQSSHIMHRPNSANPGPLYTFAPRLDPYPNTGAPAPQVTQRHPQLPHHLYPQLHMPPPPDMQHPLGPDALALANAVCGTIDASLVTVRDQLVEHVNFRMAGAEERLNERFNLQLARFADRMINTVLQSVDGGRTAGAKRDELLVERLEKLEENVGEILGRMGAVNEYGVQHCF
jgi:hypothetical protein